MFAKIIEHWKARKTVKNLEQHPIYGIVLAGIRETLRDTTKGIGKYWSEVGKSRLISDCIHDIEQNLNQPNPVQAVRIRTIELMLRTASFDVLIMQPPTEHKELSGELKQHLPELAKMDDDLEKFFYSLNEIPESFDHMWSAILKRYWVLHLYMSSYNLVRRSLSDFHEDANKDWFYPCYISFCIWMEDIYRRKLGLPSTIGGDSSHMKSIMYSTWLNRAEEGHKELRLVWDKSWEDCFHEPSPFKNQQT